MIEWTERTGVSLADVLRRQTEFDQRLRKLESENLERASSDAFIRSSLRSLAASRPVSRYVGANQTRSGRLSIPHECLTIPSFSINS